MRRTVVLAAALLIAASCGREPEAGGTVSPRASTSPSRTGSPIPTASPSASDTPISPGPVELPSSAPPGLIELGPEGLGLVSFGDPMRVVIPSLTRLLGPPTDVQRMHGDMPFGYDGMDSTARWVLFGDLRLTFGDWAESGEAEVMHFVGWDAWGRRTTNGTLLVTAEGIRVGSSVADLQAAYGPSLHLPEPTPWGCEGPPWYFGVDPDPLAFLGSLSTSPSDTDARVDGLHAGSLREGVSVSECW